MDLAEGAVQLFLGCFFALFFDGLLRVIGIAPCFVEQRTNFTSSGGQLCFVLC